MARVRSDIRRVIEAIKNGSAGPDLKAEWDALRERKTALQAKLDSADPPPRLHPGMAGLYWQRVTDLAMALQRSDTRMAASEAIRGLIDAIVLTPQSGRPTNRIEGKSGHDAECGSNATRSPETGDLELLKSDGCGGGI